MPGKTDALIVLWKLWLAIFSQLCAANYIQVSFTADVSSQMQKGRKIFFWIVPILSHWWKYSHLGAHDKCQGTIGERSRWNYERNGNKRNLSTFPLLLGSFIAFRGHETCFQDVFLSIACVDIYGFWWEAKSLIALICIFINFLKEKKRVVSRVNLKPIASAPVLELEVFGGRLYLKIWIAPFNVFNLAERGGKEGKMKWKATVQIWLRKIKTDGEKWQSGIWGTCSLENVRDNLKGTSSIWISGLRGYGNLFTNIKWGVSRNFIPFLWYW